MYLSDDGDDDCDDYEILVEEFTAPDLSSDSEPDTDVDYPDSWILVWIFKYQERFHLSDVAINVLIKFF